MMTLFFTFAPLLPNKVVQTRYLTPIFDQRFFIINQVIKYYKKTANVKKKIFINVSTKEHIYNFLQI